MRNESVPIALVNSIIGKVIMSNQALRDAIFSALTDPMLFNSEGYGFTRTDPDPVDDSVFRRVTYFRRDGSKIAQSSLTNKVNDKYLRETVVFYETNGADIRETIAWDLQYTGDVLTSRTFVQNP